MYTHVMQFVTFLHFDNEFKTCKLFTGTHSPYTRSKIMILGMYLYNTMCLHYTCALQANVKLAHYKVQYTSGNMILSVCRILIMYI